MTDNSPGQAPSGFEKVVWSDGCLLLDDLVFRIDDHSRHGGVDYFDLYKSKPLIEQFATFVKRVDLRAGNVVELGIWDGGSAALWFEVLQPDKLVAIDISPRGDTTYFSSYVRSRGLENRLRTYWDTDQGDRGRLRQIVGNEFDGPLDVIVDDASHLYEPTKSSFETLFPLLRPGGVYIIEDWQWEHGEEFQDPGHPWAAEDSLTKLIFQLVEVTGTQRKGTIASLTIFGGFVAVERGWMSLDDPDGFALEDRICRRSWSNEPSADRSCRA